MNNHDSELEAFKQLPINYAAAAFGYRIDRKKSSRHSAVMVGKDGHKIICSTSRHDGRGIFFSTDGHTSGSIIDLVQHVTGANLGGVRKALRPLLQGLAKDSSTAGEVLYPTTTDLLGVQARFSNFELVTSSHPYLSVTRKIPDRVLLSDRFNGRIFHDPDRGSAIFPHWGSPDGQSNDRCLTGYTIKNDGVSMFSKGGKKGLWPSNAFVTDNQLVISEAAVDAISYGCMRTSIKIARFVSTGGQLNPEQPSLIKSAIAKLPHAVGGEVVAAVDNDKAGDQLIQKLTQVFNDVCRDDLTFRVDVPPTRGDDWNKVLIGQP